METVGFIGLGNLGSPMARSFQAAGYPMVVHDMREEATKPLLEGGASLARSPAEVAGRSDLTFTSLPGPNEVEAVVLGPEGILEGIREGGIYLDLSTCGPGLVRRLEPMFRQKGAHVLDAPVLSSPTRAVDRSLTVIVGGDRGTYERVHGILEAFADQIVYAGSLGSGCVCKLVQNMVNIGVRHMVAEGLTLGVKAGVDLGALMESGSRDAVGSVGTLMSQTVFSGRFEPPSFSLALARKDVGLAMELGRENNVPMQLANIVEQTMIHGINRGWAGKDRTITFLLQEESAGVEVRSRP